MRETSTWRGQEGYTDRPLYGSVQMGGISPQIFPHHFLGESPPKYHVPPILGGHNALTDKICGHPIYIIPNDRKEYHAMVFNSWNLSASPEPCIRLTAGRVDWKLESSLSKKLSFRIKHWGPDIHMLSQKKCSCFKIPYLWKESYPETYFLKIIFTQERIY